MRPDRLAGTTGRLDAERQGLKEKQIAREAWLAAHPEAARRLARVD